MSRFDFYIETDFFYDGEGGSPPPPPPPPPPPTPPKTFTQEQVDKMMAEHRKNLQKENGELVTQLEELRKNSALTQAEKDALDARIANLTQQHLTKEQLTAAEVEKLKKTLTTTTETLSAEGKKWQGNFQTLLVKHAIHAGAVKHNAANAEQLEAILMAQAKVMEDVDDTGKPTGNFIAKIPVRVLDAKTQQWMTLELPIEEGIGKMRENPANANLFLTDGKPGYGGLPNVGGNPDKPLDWAKMTPSQHREARTKLGLNRHTRS